MEQPVEYCSENLPLDPLFTLMYVDDLTKLGVEKKKKKLASTSENFYYIGHDSSLLPFLTIEENMLIGVTKKELAEYQDHLAQWTHYFKLNDNFLGSKPTGIKTETCLLIHLIRAFSLHRELIFIDDLSLNLSQEFVDTLTPTLITLANDLQLSIIFMTNRMALIEKYPDRTVHLDNQKL